MPTVVELRHPVDSAHSKPPTQVQTLRVFEKCRVN